MHGNTFGWLNLGANNNRRTAVAAEDAHAHLFEEGDKADAGRPPNRQRAEANSSSRSSLEVSQQLVAGRSSRRPPGRLQNGRCAPREVRSNGLAPSCVSSSSTDTGAVGRVSTGVLVKATPDREEQW